MMNHVRFRFGCMAARRSVAVSLLFLSILPSFSFRSFFSFPLSLFSLFCATLLLAFVPAALPPPCHAQPQDFAASSFRLDPFFAYEFGRLLSLERNPGALTWCGTCSGEGTSYNHLFRFGASALFGAFPSRSLRGNVRLSLGFSSGKFVSDPYAEPVVNPRTDEAFQTEQEFTVSAVTATLGLDGLLAGEIGSGWSLLGGAWMEYRILSRFVHTTRILSPEDVNYYENNSRTRVVAEGDLLGSAEFGGGVLFAISRRIPLSDRLGITPELSARMNGEAFARGLGFRAFGGGIGLAVQLPEPQRPEPLPAPPLPPGEPPPPPPPRQPTLTADVDLFCVDASGEHRQEGGLIPRVTRIRRRTPPQSERIIRDFHAPRIRVTPRITAEAGVKWWGLSIRQGDVEIARATSDNPDRSIELDIRAGEGERPLPLTAELLAEDSTGAVAGARDLLAFTPAQGENAMPDGAITVEEEWWIPASRHGEQMQGTEMEDGMIVAEIVEAVRAAKKKGSSVETIIYSFEPSGTAPDAAHRKRAEGIAASLVAAGIAPLRSSRPPDAGDIAFSPGEDILIAVRSVTMPVGR